MTLWRFIHQQSILYGGNWPRVGRRSIEIIACFPMHEKFWTHATLAQLFQIAENLT